MEGAVTFVVIGLLSGFVAQFFTNNVIPAGLIALASSVIFAAFGTTWTMFETVHVVSATLGVILAVLSSFFGFVFGVRVRHAWDRSSK